MRKIFSAISLLLLTASGIGVARAQTSDPNVAIPVRLGNAQCSNAPKFRPTLNGKPVHIRQEMGPKSDQVILIVFDLTGNISRIDAAKQTVVANIAKLPSNAWVGVMRSQNGLHVLTDPTDNHNKVTTIIQSLTSTGQPGLLETVRATLTLADAMIRKSPVRVAVLYITDGSIYDYREDYTNPVVNPSDHHDLSRRFRDGLINAKIAKLERHVSSLEAPLYVVQLHYRQNGLDQAYQNGLEALARRTGGEALECHSLSEIPTVINGLFHQIRKTWRLNLSVPPKSGDHLQVGLSASCGDQDLHQLAWRAHFHMKQE